MRQLIINILLIIIALPSYADEICTYMTGKASDTSLERFITSCSAQKKFAEIKEVRDMHQTNLHTKLAEKLAKQIEQNSEELAVLTNYFHTNHQDLSMGSKEVAEECTLNKVAAIEECKGSTKSSSYKEKLNLLKKSLHKSKTNFSNDTSLFGIIAGKFTADLAGEESACPVNSKSGGFLIQSQIDESSAQNIIEEITSKNSLNDDEIFGKYAQLKFIADDSSKDLMKEFKQYLKDKPSSVKANVYLSRFFFNKDNHKRMVPILTNKCKKINDNLQKFLCSDLTELASLNDSISKQIFSKLSTEEDLENQYEVDFTDPAVLTAYGMQCLAKEKKVTSKNINKNSLDNWYASFTNATRTHESTGNESNDLVKNFCSIYECKNEEVKKATSCISGGPISASDLWSTFQCSSQNSSCDRMISKYHTFLQSLEKVKNTSPNSNSTSLASGRKDDISPPPRLPSFAENYLGIEGSLRALGRPVTAETIAEKTKEHEDRVKIEDKKVATKTEEAPINVPVLKQKEPEVVEVSPTQDENSASVEKAKNEFATNRINESYGSQKLSEKKPDEAKRSAIIPKNEDSDSLKETKRIREEMEQIIAGMKDAGQDTTAMERELSDVSAIENRRSALGSSASFNRAEEDRLKRWDQSLKDRSRDLDQYKRELDDRDFAGKKPTRDDSSRAPGAAPGSATAAANGDASARDATSAAGSNSSASGGQIRLSASNSNGVKGEQKPETAAIIQAGKESSTMTTDELVRLSPENLKQFGIDASKPFTLRVNFNNKTYDIPVKNFSYRGSVILGPIIDKKNKELNEFLLKSPLFKEYYNYQIQRELNR